MPTTDDLSFRRAVVERLIHEFGQPLRAADTCQWEFRPAGGEGARRLTIFMDGSSAFADGWLSVAPHEPVERILVASEGSLDALIDRCKTLCRPGHAQKRARHD